MIRTGYLRWEIDVTDERSKADAAAREVIFLARPTYRTLRVKSAGNAQATERFLNGEEAYETVIRHLAKDTAELDHVIPDVGPRPFRYSESDRLQTPRFWMAKLQREANAFAHDVVRAASAFPEMVIANPALRAGYAKLVEFEIFRVIEGRSVPQPTIDEPMRLDVSAGQASGIPELVAAELVRDVVDAKEFDEFCRFDCVTVLNGGKYYRIPRRPHGLIEVWDAKTRRAETRLCVVFQDPGMPPSDEVVMKDLLAKHQPDILWQVGIKFSPPKGKFEAIAPKRWAMD